MLTWDCYERECIYDHGWQIDEKNNGILILTKEQFESYQYSGHSLKNPEQKTLMIPSLHGSCLIFENLHFIVK